MISASVLLIRMMPPGSLERVIYRMDALYRLELAGVPILNSPRAAGIARRGNGTRTLFWNVGDRDQFEDKSVLDSAAKSDLNRPMFCCVDFNRDWRRGEVCFVACGSPVL